MSQKVPHGFATSPFGSGHFAPWDFGPGRFTPGPFGPGRFAPRTFRHASFLDQDVSPPDFLDLDVSPPDFLDLDVSPPDFLDLDVSHPNILDQDVSPPDNCFIIQNICFSWKFCHLGEFKSNLVDVASQSMWHYDLTSGTMRHYLKRHKHPCDFRTLHHKPCNMNLWWSILDAKSSSEYEILFASKTSSLL